MAGSSSLSGRGFGLDRLGMVCLAAGLVLTTFDFLWAFLVAPMVNGDMVLGSTYVIGGKVIDHIQVFTQKIFYFHVPVAIVSFGFIIAAAVYAFLYLTRRTAAYDIRVKNCMVVGMTMILMTMVSGDMWTRAEWGVWWSWEPRLTTYFILTMLTLAYFLLRTSIDDPEKKARFSAIFAIVAAVDAPISFFITRMVPSSLHPVISYSGLEPLMLIPFICGIFGMSLAAFGIYRLVLRADEQAIAVAELKRRYDELG